MSEHHAKATTRVLQLTSPHMKGDDVARLQSKLVQRGYLKGQVDGEYGPLTAQAVYRAKYRLGYGKPDQVAAKLLYDYLSGAKQPTAAMKARAKKRAKAAPKRGGLMREQKLVQKACSQLGQTEHPAGSNRCKFSIWYGLIGAWCAMLMTWTHVALGYSRRSFVKGSRYAYVPFVVGDARAGRNGLMLAHGPADAILACFDWQHDGTADHIGMCAEEATLRRLVPKALEHAIREFGPLGAGDFWCVEGNTAVGNDSNGGMVMLRKRNRSLVQAFVKVAA